jgi:hypothetical protein
VITKYQHKVTDCQRSKRITRNKKRGRGGHYRVQIYGASLFGTRASYYRKDLLVKEHLGVPKIWEQRTRS